MGFNQGKLFLRRLPPEITEEQISDYFSRYGRVLRVQVRRDQITGRPDGSGYLIFADPSILGRILAVKHTLNGCKEVRISRADKKNTTPQPFKFATEKRSAAHAEKTTKTVINKEGDEVRISSADKKNTTQQPFKFATEKRAAARAEKATKTVIDKEGDVNANASDVQILVDEEFVNASYSKAVDVGDRVSELEKLRGASNFQTQELELLLRNAEEKCRRVEVCSEQLNSRVSELSSELEAFRTKSSRLEARLQVADETEMELRHLLNIATEEGKHFEDMSTINGEKLLQSENSVEVLQSELKCAHDRLGTVEKELEMAGVRENEILEKLQSVEEQLEQHGRAVELANTRVLDLETCHESVANALELKLREATASLNLKESEANELNEKLVSLKDQTTVYQVLATKATGEVVSMKAVLEDNAMRIITLEKNLEELRRKISESEAKSEQFIFENDAVADKNSKLQEELIAYQSKVNELNELLNTIQAEKEISTVMEENNLLNQIHQTAMIEHEAVPVLIEEHINEQKVDRSQSSSSSMTSEITTSKLQTSPEVLQPSECKSGILSSHFQVPNIETSGLTFGSFHAKGPVGEDSSTPLSDSTCDVVEISLSIHDESPTGRRSPSLATGQYTMMLPALTDLSLQERVGDLKSDAPDSVAATLGSTYFVNDKDQISTVMEDNCLERYTTREHQGVTVLFEEQIGEQKTVDMSKSSSNTMTWEITTSRPQKNQEVLQLSECKHVILPHYFKVPNLEISGLSFGNFNTGLLRDTTLAKGSTPFSDSTREVEEISSRIHDETLTAHGKGRCSPSLATGQDKMMLPAVTELSLQERVGDLKSDAPDSVAATLGSTYFVNDKDQISTVMEDSCLDRYTTREHQAVTVLFEEQIGEQKIVDMSKSSSNTMTWEITTSRPQKNQEVLQLSECKRVIIPHLFEVPNLEISGLSSGNFNAGLLRDTTLAKGSTPFSDSTREVEEISSRIHDGTSTAHGEGQRSPSLATVQDKMMLPAITELSLQEHAGGLKSDAPDCVVATAESTLFVSDKDQSSGGLKLHAPDSGVATEGSTFSFIEKTLSNMGLMNHEDQHAKMKLIALRRAQELQQEEEERKRVQKARSVAKLEELQRRTWKQSSHQPKGQQSKYPPRGVSQYQWRVKVNNNN